MKREQKAKARKVYNDLGRVRRGLLAITATAVGAGLYAMEHRPVLLGAVMGAAVFVAAHLYLRHPNVGKVAVTFLPYMMIAPAAAAVFLYGTVHGPYIDVIAGAIAMDLLGVLIAVVAFRTSYGRVWVTTACTFFAVVVITPLIVINFVPKAGFYGAFAAAAIVLGLRANTGSLNRLLPWRLDDAAVVSQPSPQGH